MIIGLGGRVMKKLTVFNLFEVNKFNWFKKVLCAKNLIKMLAYCKNLKNSKKNYKLS
jgi:hypothetical protein